MVKTLYQVLELSRTAGPDAISAAYKRLADKYSPEKSENIGNADAQNLLKAVTEAHRVLSDTQRKSRYDTYLESLDDLSVTVIKEKFWTPIKIALASLFFVLAGFGYFNYHLAQLEKERQIAAMEREKQEAEAEAERLRLQEDETRKERQAQALQFVQGVGASIQSRQAFQEGQQIIQQEAAAEQRAKMDAQRTAQQAAAAADRQAALEKQRYDAQQRQEQYPRQMDQARQDRLAAQQRMFNLQQQRNQGAAQINDIKLRSMQEN